MNGTSSMPSYVYDNRARADLPALRLSPTRAPAVMASSSARTTSQGSEPPPSRVQPLEAQLPTTTRERMILARERIRAAAESGQRMRSYEVALDVDMSEFHFARQFRLAFGSSPHVFYDEIRADRARALLAAGESEGQVARRIGFRRPAELRALLAKRPGVVTP